MSFDINAEIEARKAEVFDQLEASKPDYNLMVEVLEDEFSMLVDTITDNFDEYFHDNGVALNAYENLTEADEETVYHWQSEVMNRVLSRYAKKVADRYKI